MAVTDFQAKAAKLGYPTCPICGLHMPKENDGWARLAERGCCDFCWDAGLHPDTRDRWPEGRDELGGASGAARGYDAVRYERYGPYDPDYPPRSDSDTLVVEREREGNARDVRAHTEQFGRSRLVQRLRARAEERTDKT